VSATWRLLPLDRCQAPAPGFSQPTLPASGFFRCHEYTAFFALEDERPPSLIYCILPTRSLLPPVPACKPPLASFSAIKTFQALFPREGSLPIDRPVRPSHMSRNQFHPPRRRSCFFLFLFSLSLWPTGGGACSSLRCRGSLQPPPRTLRWGGFTVVSSYLPFVLAREPVLSSCSPEFQSFGRLLELWSPRFRLVPILFFSFLAKKSVTSPSAPHWPQPNTITQFPLPPFALPVLFPLFFF